MRLKSGLFLGSLLILSAGGMSAVIGASGGDTTPKPADPANAALDRLFSPDQGETRAVQVIRDGKLVYERYAPGYSDANRFISWSMAKSATAVLIGALVADGKLALDAPVPFAEWQKPGDPRAAITLRQMLHMSSGLAHVEVGEPIHASDTNQILFVKGTGDMARRALAKALEAPPGSTYEYSSMTSLLLSELITRQLTNSRDPKVRAAAYKTFAEARLFRPAGITSAVLDFDGAGTQIGGSIIYMSLDDWGRFGQTLLTGKGVDGSTVIAPEWLAFLRTPSMTDAGYGGHVWLNRPRSGENARYPALFPGKGPDSLFAAVGHLGQYVIVSPDQRLVVVRLGKTQDENLQPVRDALGDAVAAFGG
jgi:CubicO group peptidase (beta-lactamase class C family)